ncbi:hypothetical protein [Arcobacter porcinus]|uniref:Uncharacterized protein n=1 Tax=Arcobacter porcinus TaxID=1935204 RepID=A0ABX2YAJ4_9BACT|nr:hypothetical protein [Arcobacter porcinus]OCL81767.1 hypothetical protein AAW29_01740 [Arcobacter porcinus]OCL82256.1 hypothetical protein AAW30_01541 [Arcobacter porcinus]OCL90757.1 hypothetical protein AAX28_01574 [Arcobacter porcinus]
MIKKTILTLAIFTASSAFAHSALMSCFDNGDNTITCEGGFSDGSSASGVNFKVVKDGKVIIQTKIDENSEITFDKPNGDFNAILDGGEGHEVIVKAKDIN